MWLGFVLFAIGIVPVWHAFDALKNGEMYVRGGTKYNFSQAAPFSFWLAVDASLSFTFIGLSLFKGNFFSDLTIGIFTFIGGAASLARILFVFFVAYLVAYVAITMRYENYR